MNFKEGFSFEASFNYRFADKYFSWLPRMRLKNKDFSLICNNCVAGGIYHKLGLPYTTPTVGLFFFAEDYIKFLENLQYYLLQPLKFKDYSVHPEANKLRQTKRYPIGVLGNNVEVHFLHYKNEAEAAAKWKRRLSRLNIANLYFIFSDAEADFTEDLLFRYERLPFEHKIFLSSKPRSNYKCAVFVREYANSGRVGDSTRSRKYEKNIDVIRWLNGEKNFLKKVEA